MPGSYLAGHYSTTEYGEHVVGDGNKRTGRRCNADRVTNREERAALSSRDEGAGVPR